MRVFLETHRLVLRRFTVQDADNVVALDSDPDVMRYINGGRPTAPDEVREKIIPAWLAYYDRYEAFGFWAAIEKSTGEFLGWFHLRPHPDGPRSDGSARLGVELGYRLRRSAWGRGYASEGALALIRKSFTELDVERVYAETMAVNTRSRRVMEKAGLRYVRTFHQDWPDRIPGDQYGDVEYALTRAEWREAAASG